MKNEISRIDHNITAKLQDKPKCIKPIMQFISMVGHPILLTPIAFVVSVLSFRFGQTKPGYIILLGCVAVLLNSLLKKVLRRERPDTNYSKKMWPKTYSFPSGHSFTAAVFFGIASYYIYTLVPCPCSIYIVGSLVLMVAMIGYTRIYLGAHYLLDVVAGWILGLLTAALLIMIAEI